MIRRYGLYSSRSCGMPCPTGALARREGVCVANSESPLVCPRCSCRMHILAVITNPGEVKKILRHLVQIGRPPPPRIGSLDAELTVVAISVNLTLWGRGRGLLSGSHGSIRFDWKAGFVASCRRGVANRGDCTVSISRVLQLLSRMRLWDTL